MERSSPLPRQRLQILQWIPAAAWMGTVLTASGEAMSHDGTSRFFYPLMQRLIPGIREETIEFLHFLARKGGHVMEYTFLAGLLWFAVGSWRTGWGKVRLVWGLAIFCAALDEWRQSFSPSRGASVGDVCIDAAGAALGIGLILLWQRLFRRET